MALVRGSPNPIPFAVSPYADDMSRCLLYLDDIHTRGSDFRLPLDTINAFLEMVVLASVEDRRALTAGMRKLIEKIGDMDEARRWQFARGPLSAFLVTLLQHSWIVKVMPEGGVRVTRPRGAGEYDLDLDDAMLTGAFAKMFSDDLRLQLWEWWFGLLLR